MFLLLRGFLLTSSPSLFTLNLKVAFSLQRSFGNKSPWARIWSHLLCLCIDCNNLKTVSRALVIGGEVYVAGQGRKTADWLKKIPLRACACAFR